MNPDLLSFKEMTTGQGMLVALEEKSNIPFEMKRVYYIYGTPEDSRRGFHAHKDLQQIAICINGSCSFLMDNGREKYTVELNSPAQGLFIDAMVWHEMYDFSSDCVLMVIASDFYDESDYIRNYQEFMRKVDNVCS